MGFLDFLTGAGAYRDAGKTATPYYDTFRNQLTPFSNAGEQQLSTLGNAQDDLLHPQRLLEEWIKSYKVSPFAQQSLNNAKTSGLDAASSMGLLGSSNALSNIQHGASNIMNQDRTQYLNDLMQKYMSGLGVGQSILSTGSSAANTLGQGALSFGGDMAGIKYGEKSALPNFLQNLIGMMITGSSNAVSPGAGVGTQGGASGFGHMAPVMEASFGGV